jgi:hypothetical protein
MASPALSAQQTLELWLPSPPHRQTLPAPAWLTHSQEETLEAYGRDVLSQFSGDLGVSSDADERHRMGALTRPRRKAWATASARLWTPSFVRMRWMCVATVFGLM